MSRLPKVKGMKKVMHLASCFGAAIVILGALFKIMHYPGAGIMLPVGLIVETLLFVAFGLDIPHEEVDWTLAYPELAGMGHDETHHALEEAEDENQLPVTAQLDNLLADAKIGPELIESLGSGIRNLTTTTEKIADISNAAAATNDYVQNVQKASSNVSELADTYKAAADSMSSLASSNDAGMNIGQSLNKVSENLSALNATYELQLNGSRMHLEATSKFYDGLGDLMRNLNDSVEDTRKYREQMATLSTNLTALNTVYGNMLSAMNIKPQQ
jgi:gliding motility-associated protein GldL